jgi:hypothetical protein
MNCVNMSRQPPSSITSLICANLRIPQYLKGLSLGVVGYASKQD